jgi:hypothetical protein
MVTRPMITSCAAGAIVMGGLSIVVPAAWAFDQQMSSEFAYPVTVRQISLANVTSADSGLGIRLDDQLEAAVIDLCTHARTGATRQSPSSRWQRKCRQHAWAEAKQQIAAAVEGRPTDKQLAMNTLPITISSQ